MGFPDPAKATGSYEQVIAEFRSVRDAMSRDILALLALGDSSCTCGSRMSLTASDFLWVHAFDRAREGDRLADVLNPA